MGGKHQPKYKRKRGRKTSAENEALLEVLKPSEQDVMKMLAAQTHIGRQKAHTNMMRYIWKRRPDGVHIINLEKTWAKMILAARILVTVREPSDICVMSTRTFGQRGAIKFAHYTGATALVGKWVPGTFTNPQNKAFFEPRLVIVDDPSTCFAALRETSYVGIPVIALSGTDNNSRFVDCAIPCNNRGKFSIGLMFWLLARELLRMRGDHSCIRKVEWKESVDLFFYRDADEIKRQQDAKQNKLRREKEKAAGYAQQAQQEEDEIQGQDEYADDVQGYDDNDQDMMGQGNVQQDGQYEQENWDMPATAIDDWGNDDAMQQNQQQQVDEYGQEQQQQQQQYGQDQYGQQQPQGYEDPNDGGMHMQNW